MSMLCEEDSPSISVLGHVLNRHGSVLGLVDTWNRDLLVAHLENVDSAFLAKFWKFWLG